MKTLDWHINALGLSNDVLDSLLSTACISNQYLGSFPVSQLKNIPTFSLKHLYITLIINVGHHFVSLCIGRKFVLYIDSFGRPIQDRRVTQFIEKRAPDLPIYYNSTRIQSKSSSYCGLYAVLYVLYFDCCNNFKGGRKNSRAVIGQQQNSRKPISVSGHPPRSIHINHNHPPMTMFFYKNNSTQLLGNDALCISYIKRLADMFINKNKCD